MVLFCVCILALQQCPLLPVRDRSYMVGAFVCMQLLCEQM